MVAKQVYLAIVQYLRYLLAKIHMVAKHKHEYFIMNIKLSSSKNPYGSKTLVLIYWSKYPLSSSKNPYGSKTQFFHS